MTQVPCCITCHLCCFRECESIWIHIKTCWLGSKNAIIGVLCGLLLVGVGFFLIWLVTEHPLIFGILIGIVVIGVCLTSCTMMVYDYVGHLKKQWNTVSTTSESVDLGLLQK